MQKILIVEDNKSVLALLMKQFVDAGFDVLGAPDAMLGTKGATQWRPDLLLLDLMLPAGGGLAVLRALRQSVHTKQTPVLVLTGTVNEATRKPILDYGVHSFIQKPHNPDELMALVKHILHLDGPTA